MNLRRNETQITIRDPFTLCLTFKNSKDYGEPNITYQLAGCGETPNGVPWWYGEGGYIPKIV